MRICHALAALPITLLGIGMSTPACADVLVFGGTGQLGARIVRLLLAEGEDVTVFARPTSNRRRLQGLGVDYAVGDMTNDADVAAAFEPGPDDRRMIERVIIAVRAPLGEIGFYSTISDNVARHAQEAGVSQIIYHGAVGAGSNMAVHDDVPWDSVPGLAARMEHQGKAEATFLGSGIAATIIRNSRVWPDDTPATGKAELTEDQSVLTPMTRADLALLTMNCLANSGCENKIFHVRDTSLTWPPPQTDE